MKKIFWSIIWILYRIFCVGPMLFVAKVLIVMNSIVHSEKVSIAAIKRGERLYKEFEWVFFAYMEDRVNEEQFNAAVDYYMPTTKAYK